MKRINEELIKVKDKMMLNGSFVVLMTGTKGRAVVKFRVDGGGNRGR